jgi:hypothetical protein
LHDRAINEVVTDIITEELTTIHRYIRNAQNALISNLEISKNWKDIIKRQDSTLEIKNEIIQEKNAEIARLQKRWWKIF